MLEFRIAAFYDVTIRLTEMVSWIAAKGGDENSSFRRERLLDAEDRSFIKPKFEGLVNHLDTLAARVSVMAAEEAELYINNSRATWGGMAERINDIRKTLSRELRLAKAFTVEPGKQHYFEPTEPLFGIEVERGFPSASYDIGEAGKCLALDRSTASAFHSVRCLEAAIGALARCLAIPDPTKAAERNWGKVLDKVKVEVDRRWPTSTARLTGDGRIFGELYAALAALQNPYRNATMHMDEKYTEEEAKYVFDVVGGLMRRVASRCDEMGEPKARPSAIS